MILSLWKYLEGYVVIKIKGFAPERFINLCANKNIYLWNIKKIPDGYMFSMSGKAFFLLGPIARKTRCRVKIYKKVGVPFKFHLFRKRKFFLGGLLISLLMVIFLSFFVWHIEIDGNLTYTTEEITRYLKDQHNIDIGTFKTKIDCSRIDNLLLTHFDKAMWVSSELKGTQLIIHVREGVEPNLQKVNDRTCDLVTPVDGTILSIVMRKGTPMVKAGDLVKRGDILVSGTLEIKELAQLKAVEFTYSDADITLKFLEPYEDEIAYTYIDKVYWTEKQKNDRQLKVFHLELNLFKPRLKEQHYDTVVKYDQVQLLKNFYLPIFLTKTTYLPYYEIEKIYTREEAKALLIHDFELALKKMRENNIQILSNDVLFKEDKGKLLLSGYITLAKQIGDKVYFDESIRRLDYNELLPETTQESP